MYKSPQSNCSGSTHMVMLLSVLWALSTSNPRNLLPGNYGSYLWGGFWEVSNHHNASVLLSLVFKNLICLSNHIVSWGGEPLPHEILIVFYVNSNLEKSLCALMYSYRIVIVYNLPGGQRALYSITNNRVTIPNAQSKITHSAANWDLK